jgi:hypothetical protein
MMTHEYWIADAVDGCFDGPLTEAEAKESLEYWITESIAMEMAIQDESGLSDKEITEKVRGLYRIVKKSGLTQDIKDQLVAVIGKIESKDYDEAIADIKGMQPGINWSWYDEETDDFNPQVQWAGQEMLDCELYGIVNSLQMARMYKYDKHFANHAILEIKVLIGVNVATERLAS